MIFTKYIRALEPGKEPDPEVFNAMWKELLSVLKGELRRRGLWLSPPSYLGIYDSSRWDDPDALHGLASWCYVDVFADRLQGLKAQLRMKDDIDGVVWRCIRNLLFDAQKKHDLLGYRVFEILRLAVRQMLALGQLHKVAPETGTRISNDTVLSFAREATEARPVDLGEYVRPWPWELLPELITARGKKKEEVAERLAARIFALRDEGIELFRFKEIVNPLKTATRRHWTAVHAEGETGPEEGDSESPNLVPKIRPDAGFIEQELFDALLSCVAEAIDQFDGQKRTQSHYEKLWDFVRVSASENAGAFKQPSGRNVAKLLDIPRQSLKALRDQLAEWIRQCRESLSGAQA